MYGRRGRGSRRPPPNQQPQTGRTNKNNNDARPKEKPRIPLELLSTPSRTEASWSKQPSLLDEKTQEEYRQMIQGKIDDYIAKFPMKDSLGAPSVKQNDSAQNILIFLRRLREGIIASNRVDAFAIEVSETAGCWSIIFNESAQATSIFSHLQDLYRKRLAHESSKSSTTPGPHVVLDETTSFIRLFHILRAHLPSQMEFHNAMRLLPATEKETSHILYIKAVATAIRRSNYVALERMTDFSTNEVLRKFMGEGVGEQGLDNLKRWTIIHLVRLLQDTAREQNWAVVRASYREISSKSDVKRWLAGILLLSDGDQTSLKGQNNGEERIEEWMSLKAKLGEIVAKEGMTGWLIRKA